MRRFSAPVIVIPPSAKKKFMTNAEVEKNDAPDVAPPVVIQTLTLLWIALFGGRWIAVSLLQWNGILLPEQVAAFDSGILSRLYLILLALTILIVALRFARSLSAPSPDPGQEPRQP